jgi:hypothetical protein
VAVTYSDLVRVASEHHGKERTTHAGRATLRVFFEGGSVYVEPTSTGIRRDLGAGTRKNLELYNQTGSMTPVDYQDLTFNSDYVLRLISLVPSPSKR